MKKEVVRYTNPHDVVTYHFVLQWHEGKRNLAEVLFDTSESTPAHTAWFPIRQGGKVEILPASFLKVRWRDRFVRQIAESENPLKEIERIGRGKFIMLASGKMLS